MPCRALRCRRSLFHEFSGWQHGAGDHFLLPYARRWIYPGLAGRLFRFATGPWGSLVSVFNFPNKYLLDYLLPVSYLHAKFSWLGALWVLILDPREGLADSMPLVSTKARQTTRDLDRNGSRPLGPQLIEGFHNPSSMRTILMGDDEDVYIYIYIHTYIHICICVLWSSGKQ